MAAVSGCSDREMQSCAKGDYAEIVVIRHGETEWNASRRVQGQVDVKLNDVGRKQAVAVAARLSREPKISVVYSSDLDRAHETAKIIASSCGGIEVIKDPDLRERHMGDLQGLAFPEIDKVNPVSHKALVSPNKDQEIPGGGESTNQLYNRCTSAVQRIAKKHKGERVVVVTHGGLIISLHGRASRNELPGGISNTSVSVFHVSDDEWLIQSWGDISHLKETEFLESAFGGDGISASLMLSSTIIQELYLLNLDFCLIKHHNMYRAATYRGWLI